MMKQIEKTTNPKKKIDPVDDFPLLFGLFGMAGPDSFGLDLKNLFQSASFLPLFGDISPQPLTSDVGAMEIAGGRGNDVLSPAYEEGNSFAAIPAIDVSYEPQNDSFFYNAFQTAAAFGSGVVSGVASIPEGLYDTVDSVTGDILPGDATKNSTSDANLEGAKFIGVDVENHQMAVALGELTSIAVPAGGLVGVFAKGGRIVQAVNIAEKTSDGIGMVQLGSAIGKEFIPG